MQIVYNILLVDCLGLFQSFSACKARMCTNSMCPRHVIQHLTDISVHILLWQTCIVCSELIPAVTIVQ